MMLWARWLLGRRGWLNYTSTCTELWLGLAVAVAGSVHAAGCARPAQPAARYSTLQHEATRTAVPGTR